MPATPQERQKVKLLIEENLRTQNPYLDLGCCGLDGTEPELAMLAECVHLETLIFANAWWEKVVEKNDEKIKIEIPDVKIESVFNELFDFMTQHDNILFKSFRTIKEKLNINAQFVSEILLDLNTKETNNSIKWVKKQSNNFGTPNYIKLIPETIPVKIPNILIPAKFKRVMIIDDNNIDTLISTTTIKGFNFADEIFVFDTAQAGFEYLKNAIIHKNDIDILPELLLIDFRTTVLEGFDFLNKYNKLSKELTDKTVNVFVISSSTNPKDINKAKKYDFVTDYLSTPFTREVLNKLGNYQNSILKPIESFKSSEVLFLYNLELISIIHKEHKTMKLLSVNNLICEEILLDKLPNLKFAYLGQTNVKNITLKNLPKLTYFSTFQNNIDTIHIECLPKITYLNLSDSKLKDIFINDLPRLKKLDLSNNYLQDFSFDKIKSLPNLRYLSLCKNPIKNIPKEIFNHYGNVLEEVRNYLEDTAKGKAKNNEIKVIFIGNGNVGKTQIAKRMVEGNNFIFDEEHKSTHAIVLLEKTIDKFQLQIWDFAGQDIYHATHRLFMQTRALFVLVWDWENENNETHTWEGKEYQNEKLDYWLEYAQCFAPESPILILQNKIDEFTDDFYFEYKEKLKQKYPILDFLRVSAKSGKGFMVLEDTLTTIFTENEVFKTPDLPIDWIKIRQDIRAEQTKDTKTISFEAFEALCEKYDVQKSTATLLAYLHDTGVLYYRVGYFQNQIILNQDWAIQAIYKVLNRESDYFEVLEKQKGRLLYKNIVKIWQENTDDERRLFIDFMLSAELAFETKENKEWGTPLQERSFIIPQLLPLAKDNDILTWEHNYLSEKTHSTEKKYSFLPKVFIQQFIVKANLFSEVRLMWQKGLALQTQEGYALVEACYEKGNQRISIKATNSFLIQKIEEELNNISQESKVKADKSGDDKDKFGLAALKPIIENKTQNNMNEHIQRALLALNNANYSGYFEEMDKIIPQEFIKLFSELRMQFIAGDTSWKFSQQLEDFAKTVNKSISNSSPQTQENMSKEQNPKDDSGKIVINFNPTITQNQTVTQTQNNTQSFNFEAFAQALPHLKRELKFVEEELQDSTEPEAQQALKEIQKLQESTKKIEEEAKTKDESKVKESTFWKRLGNFGKSLGTWGSKYLTPDSIKTLGKTANEVSQLGTAFGIDTGFDFSNYGAE